MKEAGRFIGPLGWERGLCEAHFDAERPGTCPEEAWPLSAPATSRQLLHVVHEAVQMPLRSDLVCATQVQTAQALVVLAILLCL